MVKPLPLSRERGELRVDELFEIKLCCFL